MKNVKTRIQLPTIKALKADLEENEVHLKIAGYFVREKAQSISESIRVMRDSVRRLAECTRSLAETLDGRDKIAA